METRDFIIKRETSLTVSYNDVSIARLLTILQPAARIPLSFDNWLRPDTDDARNAVLKYVAQSPVRVRSMLLAITI